MKKYLVSFLVILVILFGCEQPVNNDGIEFFGGEHKLQRMTNSDSYEVNYFLLGGYGTSEKKVTFSWQSYDSIYNFTTLKLSQIRIKIVKDKEPVVLFTIKQYLRNFDYPEDINKHHVWIKTAIIECDEKYWNININLPLNEDEK